MANTRELRRRIRSVKNTSQITKAMQMVAATKMRRAQNQAVMGRPYSSTLVQTLANLAGKVNPEMHPLFRSKTSEGIAVVVFSTDKSLCGALNTNLFRAIQNFSHDKKDLSFYTIGKKGRQFIAKTGKNLVADFENTDVVTFQFARQIAKMVTESFLKGEVKEVYLAYPNFISTLRQEPRVTKLLPIDASVIEEANKSLDQKQQVASSEYLFEPSADALLDFVLTHEIETQVYQALLETKASEHSARMMAMQNATDNAKELVSDLELTYNQTRQAAITNELLEITTAAAALE